MPFFSRLIKVKQHWTLLLVLLKEKRKMFCFNSTFDNKCFDIYKLHKKSSHYVNIFTVKKVVLYNHFNAFTRIISYIYFKKQLLFNSDCPR